MLEAGFVRSEHDSAMFVRATARSRLILLLYVDDMIDPQQIQITQDQLQRQFERSWSSS